MAAAATATIAMPASRAKRRTVIGGMSGAIFKRAPAAGFFSYAHFFRSRQIGRFDFFRFKRCSTRRPAFIQITDRDIITVTSCTGYVASHSRRSLAPNFFAHQPPSRYTPAVQSRLGWGNSAWPGKPPAFISGQSGPSLSRAPVALSEFDHARSSREEVGRRKTHSQDAG